ncbi:MAG: nucleotidyl transferase AbiEii/AbiGii toxin family protein [Gammaproteobacteria bacterium]|nr:nucleotidyl transferase AbiEii/AbiGii toxin family protein [Gammaproteobacteria bacterium]
MAEPNIPIWVTDRLGVVLPVLGRYIPENQLLLGGGTVLQARWNHRISTDIDLFTDRQLFNTVIATSSNQLERDLCRIPAVNPERSWVDLNTVYCELDGTELTVMPSSMLVDEASGHVVPSTLVKTESTATILHKKVAARMVEAGACEIRDVFDLYTAITRDQDALNDAIRPIPQRSLDRVSALMKSRPTSWYEDTTKPLVGVDPLPDVREMVNQLAEVFGFDAN